MKKQTKKIFIGVAIFIVLGFGSVVIYHGINKNVTEPIEKATDTDAYVSNEENAGNNIATTALSDISTDKESTTEKTKDDNMNTSTEIVSNAENTSSAKDDSANTGNHTTTTNNSGTQNTNNGNSNNSSGNTNGSTKPSTTESSKPNNTTEASKPNTTTEAVKPNNNSSQNSGSKECDHKWEKVTKQVWVEPVEHTETVTVVVEEAKDVPIVEQQRHIFCSGCGSDLTAMGLTSVGQYNSHCANCQGGNASYYGDFANVTTGYEHVPEVTKTETKTVVDKAGYYKEEVTGYKCTKCGASKSK